jgi:uncharacterized membrane protein HdeD (DUF308 family)
MNESKFLKLNFKDLAKSAIIAGLTVVVTGAITILSAITDATGQLPTLQDFYKLLTSGLVAGAIYLLKNFLSNENNQFFKS